MQRWIALICFGVCLAMLLIIGESSHEAPKADAPKNVCYQVDCPECNGTHSVNGLKCTYCVDGKAEWFGGKVIKCPLCLGTGKRIGECPSCRDGKLYTFDGFVWRDCAPKNATLKQGWLEPCVRECSDCKGTGHYEGKGCNLCAEGGQYFGKWCPVCGNLGNYKGPCQRCNGTGKVEGSKLIDHPPK